MMKLKIMMIIFKELFFDNESSNNFCKLPCRLTHFTRTNFDKYNQGLPFIQHINKLFKRLIPESYQKQLDRANTKPHLKIPKTSFSTVTINRNFRTAMHRDAGDFKEGFGNLTVIERGKYHGGYTIFPQFGIGINVRTGDFLAMDVHKYHANSELYAYIDVPLGYTATKVRINGSDDAMDVEVYTLDLDDGTISGEISNTNLETNDNIVLASNHVGADDKMLFIKVVTTAADYEVWGG